jgi:hypothetical protein
MIEESSNTPRILARRPFFETPSFPFPRDKSHAPTTGRAVTLDAFSAHSSMIAAVHIRMQPVDFRASPRCLLTEARIWTLRLQSQI